MGKTSYPFKSQSKTRITDNNALRSVSVSDECVTNNGRILNSKKIIE